ncbi:MAG: replication factor C large subunit [Ferroplasma sp.]
MTLADKYRPISIDKLILNEQSKKEITDWINSWINHTETKKALILWGQQGIGKTSSAYAIANYAGLNVIEMNASEQRNRENMKRIGLMASEYRDLFNISGNPDKLILIDEADNIFESRNSATGGDTGGLSELLDIIKNTRNPIVITMNDYYGFRGKNSAAEIISHSLVIELTPYKRKNETGYRYFTVAVHNILQDVAEHEGIKIGPREISEIIKNNEPDIRAMINDLYLHKIRETDENNNRDSSESIYYLTTDTFRNGNYNEILNAVYKMDDDPDFYIKWIDENIPYEYTDIENTMNAYNLLARADILYGNRPNDFALVNYAVEMTAGISFVTSKKNTHYVKYNFPQYIKNLSQRKKNMAKFSTKIFMSKVAVISHTSISTISRDMWFYKKLRGDKETFKLFSSVLNLNDNEISVLKNKN